MRQALDLARLRSAAAQRPASAPLRTAITVSLSALLHIGLLAILVHPTHRTGDPEVSTVVFVGDLAPRSPMHDWQRTPRRRQPGAAEEPASQHPQQASEAIIAARLAAMMPSLETTLDSKATLLETLRPPALAIAYEWTATRLEQPSHERAEPPVVDVAPEIRTALLSKLTRTAATLEDAARTEIAWQEQGREFRAVLVREGEPQSMMLERVSAHVTTLDQGVRLQTRLELSRLAFSQFTQIVDRWDPNVQLHDDEIAGRFHSNSAFFVARSGEATPKFLGKVTTAARGLRFDSGARRHREEIFQGGLQTSTHRIAFPKQAAAFASPNDPKAYVHHFTEDAHVTFMGSRYSFRRRRDDRAQQRAYSPDRPAFLVAASGVTLHVRGTVRGHVLVYSPRRIVIEGSLRYANDPRIDPTADDYLGLVSDGNVEIARPHVTGRGDLRIDAAIFARRRFLVTNIEHSHNATLWIYGSVSAGTLSATEPRYGTKIEFDSRFDRVRPPGFPSTDRYELAHWDGKWHGIESALHAME